MCLNVNFSLNNMWKFLALASNTVLFVYNRCINKTALLGTDLFMNKNILEHFSLGL